MAVAVERLSSAQKPLDGRTRLVVIRSVGALAAVCGLAIALFFSVAPIHISVHERVGVTQLAGEDGTGLVVTDQTQLETRRVTCVPLLQYDTSADQNAACSPKVQGRLGLAGLGLAAFLVGCALWIASGGDRSVGFSGRRQLIAAWL
jgi:hypothetical protein